MPRRRFKQNIFALIIGIDDYINCRKLRGAVADAKAMKEYLKQAFRVPEDHICTLLDHSATRDAIIQAFKDLGNDQRIETRDPIIIFYAGHGSELPTPASWTGPNAKNKIQCLIPQDYEGSYIHPIPYRTVGSLIEGIAQAKGDNISVIFDCCHSVSGTRVHYDSYVHRSVDLDRTIPGNLDQDIWGGRARKVGPGFAYRDLQSHVLLTACGMDDLAYEHEGRGLFTTALLKTLENYDIDNLTYTEVLEHIHLNRQNPYCTGVNQHRIIFDMMVPAGSLRQVHHSVRMEDEGTYVIEAGLAHGIMYGVEFTLYDINDWKESLPLGVVVVDEAAVIKDFWTRVTTHAYPAKALFAKLTRVGNLPLHVTSGGSLSSALENIFRRMDVDDTNAPNFRVVKKDKEAKLEVTMENDLVVFRVLDQRLKLFGLTDPSFKTTLDCLTHALGAAAHYYWYLDLTKKNNHTDTKDGVVVDLHLLQESESECDEYGIPLLVPVEPGLCKWDPNAESSDFIGFVVDPDAMYGIKITNNTARDLYLNVFLFNNSSLSIAPYYILAKATSAGTPEAPLKQNTTLTIGYGREGTTPFTYSLEEGQDVDISYLKIFFATRPIDLFDITQPPPFKFSTENLDARFWSYEGAHTARNMMDVLQDMQPSEPNDTWFTFTIPVMYRLGATYYESVLRKIDERESELAQRALIWLTVALEPLQLPQLVEGVTINPQQRRMDHGLATAYGPMLLHMLSGLVTYNDTTDIITLSHSSVEEYLTGDLGSEKSPMYHVDPQDAHATVAESCISYITCLLEQQHWDGTAPSPETLKFPLLRYVFTCGFTHISHAEPGSKRILHALKALYSSIIQHPLRWDQLRRSIEAFDPQPEVTL